MGLKFLKINPDDNVAVAIVPLKKGECISVDGKEIFLQEDIPAGHKVALKDFAENEDIIKYGYAIGHARCAIIKGLGLMKGISKRIWRGCWSIRILLSGRN